MTDREMLEFAAKAAGIDAHWGDGWQSDMMFRALPRPNSPLVTNVEWNPNDDDGDALRLMVRLRLEPRFIDNSHSNGAEPSRVTLHNFAGIVENIDGDPLAATRRAIVRAAATIGKDME